jgi:hypothetical protein
MQFQFNGVFYHFTNTQLALAAVVLIVVVLIAVAAYLEHRKTKTLGLRERFGAEYDRAVTKFGTTHKAEAKLADRESRVVALKIRNLGAPEHDRFASEWNTVQSRFVDHPKAAVTEADDMINALLEARGYTGSGFEQRADDLSVAYPHVVENYRLAHAVAVRLADNEASTEELRTTMIQYRAIFDELLQEQEPSERKVAA